MIQESHDFGPSAGIISSQGPPKDRNNFYCTTYSTTHKGWARGVGGSARLSPLASGVSPRSSKVFFKRQTGYTSNLNSYVKYDPSVDEKDFKIGRDGLLTSSSETFKPPVKPNVSTTKTGDVNAVFDSGFTRMPKGKAQDFRSSADMKESIMEISYREAEFQKKPTKNDKARILNSTSAFITDVSHLDYLNQDGPLSGVKNIALPPIHSLGASSPSKSNPLKADGFSRSGLHTFLKDGYRKELLVESVTEKVAEQIKKTDLARFVDMCDLQGVASTYKLIYRDVHPVEDTLRLQKSGISIGKKESSGSVRDWPLSLHWSNTDPSERFTTETSERYLSPKKPQEIKETNLMTKSGFSRGNKYGYTFRAKTDEEEYASYNASVANLKWAQEKGIHTRRPTKLGYELRTD